MFNENLQLHSLFSNLLNGGDDSITRKTFFIKKSQRLAAQRSNIVALSHWLSCIIYF